MRLAFVTQDFPPDTGGIQTYCMEIASRISKYCDDFILIAPGKANAYKIDQSLPFDVYRIASPNTLLGIASIPSMLAVFKQRNIDTTFHVQWQTLLLSVAARKAGVIKKIMVAAHGRELYYNPFERQAGLGKGYECYKHHLLKHADHFFPVSRFTAGILQHHGIAAQNIDIVINGTNPDEFFPLQNKQTASSRSKTILTICRLVSRKGIDTVLQAFKLVLKRYPDSKYVIVGDGPDKENLQNLAKQLQINKSVQFAGRVAYEKLIEYYNACDIFVMPSKTQKPDVEGFGIVFLEANACGKPVIGSKSGGIPDAIIDGETGLLVEEQQPEQLAEAINKLFSNPELAWQMGQNGRLRVERDANWDACAAKLLNCMKNKI